VRFRTILVMESADLRYRSSICILPGPPANHSKSGASLSAGRRGGS
jgi:hypothetical protein